MLEYQMLEWIMMVVFRVITWWYLLFLSVIDGEISVFLVWLMNESSNDRYCKPMNILLPWVRRAGSVVSILFLFLMEFPCWCLCSSELLIHGWCLKLMNPGLVAVKWILIWWCLQSRSTFSQESFFIPQSVWGGQQSKVYISSVGLYSNSYKV